MQFYQSCKAGYTAVLFSTYVKIFFLLGKLIQLAQIMRHEGKSSPVACKKKRGDTISSIIGKALLYVVGRVLISQVFFIHPYNTLNSFTVELLTLWKYISHTSVPITVSSYHVVQKANDKVMRQMLMILPEQVVSLWIIPGTFLENYKKKLVLFLILGSGNLTFRFTIEASIFDARHNYLLYLNTLHTYAYMKDSK